MRDTSFGWLLTLCALLTGSATAAPIFLFQDFSLGTHGANGGSSPRHFVVLGETVYFFATDGLHGRELWRSDGTAAGTRLVADVCPGLCDSDAVALTHVGDRLFFPASDGVTGIELWTSDGTAAGTRLVADVCPGPCSGGIFEPTAAGERVFFSGYDGTTGLEPWVSDGTPQGTRPLGDLCPGQCGSFPGSWLEFEGEVFFNTNALGTGSQLWASDGTPEGTRLVKNLCLDPCLSLSRLLQVFSDKLFFQAMTAEQGSELWTSDGTSAGTALFSELVPGPEGVFLDTAIELGGRLYLVGSAYGAAGCNGRMRCVWRTEGTPATTVLAEELMPHLAPEPGPYELFSAGSLLYWTQKMINVASDELWVYDGVERRRLLGGIGLVTPIFGFPDGRSIFGTSGSTTPLWVSDGTVAGTQPLAGLALSQTYLPGEARGVLLGTRALFAATDLESNFEPWLSDGTAAGTVQLDELNPPRISSNPVDLFALDGRLLCVARGTVKMGLWGSDGTAAGTEFLAPSATGVAYAQLGNKALVSDFFGGRSLRVTDGTAAGTAEITGVEGAGKELVKVGDAVYFSAGFTGQQLWRSDGTAAGARLVKDLNPNFLSGVPASTILIPGSFSLPQELTAAGSSLYMVALRGEGEAELWKSDGTEAGTILLEHFENEPGIDFFAQGPHELTVLGGRVLFSAFSTAAGRELWVSDGTAAGTHQLADLAPGAVSSALAHFAVMAGEVFFIARQADSREELWRSDGTAAGTVRVAVFTAPGTASLATAMIAAGNRLFLSVWTLSTGAELWTSDGTAAGTRQVVELFPGALGSGPGGFLPVGGGRALFAASDPSHGRELWLSDGTAAGTLRVENLVPGSAGSNPEELTLMGDKVVFAADDATHGRELFAVKLADLPAPPPPPRQCRPDRLCLHDGRFEVGVVWRDFEGHTGSGQVVGGLDSDDSGLFWFFQPANYEFLVKVLRGCDFNGHYWVLAAATTNVGYTLTVTDTTTGEQATYANPLGRSSPAIIDIEAFDDCL